MTRSIRTTYFHAGQAVQINASSNANRAVAQCVMRMQINQYGATAAQVYDNLDGLLHADIRRSMNGTITINYKRDPEEYHDRFAAAHLLPELISR